MKRTSYTVENYSENMRSRLVATTVLVVLVMIAAPVAAQEVNEEGNLIIDVILPLALAFIMFSLGMGLTLDDFTLVFREPRAFGIGLTNQMIVLPIGPHVNFKMINYMSDKIKKLLTKKIL